MKTKIYLFLFFFVFLSNLAIFAQNPKAHWEKYKDVEQAGFSQKKLTAAKSFYDSLNSSALMIIQNGKVVVAWGEVDRRFILHSARKGILNSLYAIYSENETINLDLTIGELGIQDNEPLSELEKSARIIDLLKVRSGIFHKAAAEPGWVDDYRPERNSVPPDSIWFYNNWDFNVLGTIFEQLTNKSIYQALYEDVAVPLQMQDFRVMDGEYFFETEYSRHPAYHMKMSARDLARYGQLFLQKGAWNDNRLFSEKWVEDSTFPVSKHGGGGKIGRWYGWLWGVSEYYQDYKMYFASGTGNQFLAVFPTEDLIIVNLCNTYQKHKVYDRELLQLFDMILASKSGEPLDAPELIPLESGFRLPGNLYAGKLDHEKYLGDFEIEGKSVAIFELNDQLVLRDYYMKLRLFPVSPTRFFVEDIERFLNVELNGNGKVVRMYYD